MIRVIRSNAPESVKLFVRKILAMTAWVDMATARLFTKNTLMANIYYLLFSRRFDREHLSVLKGKVAYYEFANNAGPSQPLLRRNIHRLEKGIIMQPRRGIFAQSYINQTVDCYKNIIYSGGFCSDEIKWARDVLDEYFKISEGSVLIDSARQKFELSNLQLNPDQDTQGFYKPYLHKELEQDTVGFESVESLFMKRRSVRWYQDKKVPLALIEKSVNIASLAPSACNRQPYKFIVTTDKERAIELAECVGGTSGFSGNIPAMVIVVGDLSFYPFERDRHLIYIDSSLVSMQLMLALESLGLSTCPINWPDIDESENKIEKLVQLPAYQRIIMLLAIGYADPEGGIPYSQKKRGDSVIEVLQ